MEGTIKPVLAAWQHWMAGDQVEYFYLELVKGKQNYYYANALNEREEKCVLENFIFRNEYTRFIGHLDGEHGASFSLTSEDKIKYAANWGNQYVFFILNSSCWPEFFPLSLEQHKAPL